MNGMKKARKLPFVIVVFLVVIIGIPLSVVGLSFIGRITPDSVIPDSFVVYVSVPDTARLAENIINHHPLPDIMALAELGAVVPVFNQMRNSGLTQNRFVRMVAGGTLKAAVLPEGRFLAAWDAGIASPLLRALPLVSRTLNVPELFYVRAGNASRFEYRMEDGTVFFIGAHHNLFILSNDSAVFESVIDGTSRHGDIIGESERTFRSRNHDIALLVSPDVLRGVFTEDASNFEIFDLLNLIEFPGNIEVSLSIQPYKLNLDLVTPLGSGNEALSRLIQRNSQATPVLSVISENTQYMTMLAAGSFEELLAAASVVSGPDLANSLSTADSAARTTLGMGLDQLLFSWMGTQIAVFGLEGRAHPVIAVEIANEAMRSQVFDRAFSTIFLSVDLRLNLDGNRLPRITVPPFLRGVLSLLGVEIPSPFYTVHNNFLFISESAESLLAAVNSVRRNEVLPRQELWHSLSQHNSGPASFGVFYSLDRSLPFFLRGNNEITAILRLYRQGLVRVSLHNSVLTFSLSVIPGAGRGLVPVTGFPVDLASATHPGMRVSNRPFIIGQGRETQALMTRGNDILSINLLDRRVYELRSFGSPWADVYAAPQNPSGAANGSVWIADSFGTVSLVNQELQNLPGFPITTGIRLSAEPVAHGGKLFLSSEDGAVYTINTAGNVSRWGTFSAALRSPPAFFQFGNRTVAGIYPRDIIFGEIFLTDADGNSLSNWPNDIPGIAFGSPELFSTSHPFPPARLFAAFVTQAGVLSVYAENAQILSGFPVDLPGVFFVQPVFDGENLWLIESEGTLFRVSLYGEVLSHSIPNLSVREEGYIIASGGEIFFSGDGNVLHGFSSNFNSLDGFPLPVWGRPVIGDLFSDGQRKIAGVGMDNRLLMWQFR